MSALPPGFSVTVAGRVVFDDGRESAWRQVWQISTPTEKASGQVHLSAGEMRKIFQLGKPCYLTPKMGRPGWNVRKTFPVSEVKRGIGFIQVLDGMARKFTATRAQVRV